MPIASSDPSVGTAIGAFFGVQAGAGGKEKAETERRMAEAERSDAQKRLAQMAMADSPEERKRILAE